MHPDVLFICAQATDRRKMTEKFKHVDGVLVTGAESLYGYRPKVVIVYNDHNILTEEMVGEIKKRLPKDGEILYLYS